MLYTERVKNLVVLKTLFDLKKCSFLIEPTDESEALECIKAVERNTVYISRVLLNRNFFLGVDELLHFDRLSYIMRVTVCGLIEMMENKEIASLAGTTTSVIEVNINRLKEKMCAFTRYELIRNLVSKAELLSLRT